VKVKLEYMKKVETNNHLAESNITKVWSFNIIISIDVRTIVIRINSFRKTLRENIKAVKSTGRVSLSVWAVQTYNFQNCSK
jgi:hypothetical protein